MMTETDAIRRLAEDYENDQDDFALLGDSDYDNLEDRFMRPLPFRPSPAVNNARVNTGTGPVPVSFPQPVASAAAIERLKQDTQRAISEVRADVGKLRTDTSRRLKSVNDRIGSMQQSSMLTTLLPLLQPAPRIKSITLPGEANGEVKANTALTPTNVEFERADMTMMLLPMLLGGGLGGGGSGGGQNDMMLLAVALMASRR